MYSKCIQNVFKMFSKILKKSYFNFFIYILIGSFFFSLSFSNYHQFFSQHGDSAFFVDLIHKIGGENSIYSNLVNASALSIEKLTVDPEIYCLFGKEDKLGIDIFKNVHLYLMVFLLSLFNKLGVTALILSSITFALNFSLIILVIFFYLKKKKIQNL